MQALLEEATKIVVWMKTTDGKMQYIEAPASIAHSCYLAGHSLYFNPSLTIQERYIKALCEDLHMDFGLEKEAGFGGDLEVFAVNGYVVTLAELTLKARWLDGMGWNEFRCCFSPWCFTLRP